MLQMLQNRLNLSFIKLHSGLRDLLRDQREEDDKKVIPIAFFVIDVATSMTLRDLHVSTLFRQLTDMV